MRSATPAETKLLADLILEVLNDPPVNHCAENVDHCTLCGAEWDQWRAQFGDGIGMDHHPTCWLIRARDLLNQLGVTDA